MTIGLVKVLEHASAKQTHTGTFFDQKFSKPILLSITFCFSFKNECVEKSFGIFGTVTPMEAGPFVWGLEDFSGS